MSHRLGLLLGQRQRLCVPKDVDNLCPNITMKDIWNCSTAIQSLQISYTSIKLFFWCRNKMSTNICAILALMP